MSLRASRGKLRQSGITNHQSSIQRPRCAQPLIPEGVKGSSVFADPVGAQGRLASVRPGDAEKAFAERKLWRFVLGKSSGQLQFVLPQNAGPRRLQLSTATATVEAEYCRVLPSAPAPSRRDQRGTGRITYFYVLTGTVLQVSCVLTLRFHRACHPVSAPGTILLPLV